MTCLTSVKGTPGMSSLQATVGAIVGAGPSG
jgi:hypothetical protein